MLAELEGVATALELALSERAWRAPVAEVEHLSSTLLVSLEGLQEDQLSAAGRNFLRRLRRSVVDLPSLPAEECRERLQRTLKAVRSRLLRGADPGSAVDPQHRRRQDAPARELSAPAAVPISELKGVGPVTRDSLVAAGVVTVADLLHYLPREYQDRTQCCAIADLVPGTDAVVSGTITATRGGRGRRARFFELAVSDGTGTLLVTWFRPPPYLYGTLQKGMEMVFMGRVEAKAPPLRMSHPEFEPIEAEEGLNRGLVIPRYRQPSGLSQKVLRKLVRRAFEDFARGLPGRVPAAITEALGLLPRSRALELLHFPDTAADLPALREGRHPAHEALLFEDLFILQVALLRRRAALRGSGCSASGNPQASGQVAGNLERSLPFALTAAQRRVLGELRTDLAADTPMQRLVQGDVGAGKTVLALLAAAELVERGDQVVVLAPTEVLAFQWWDRAVDLYRPLGFEVALLTGGQGAAARRHNRALVASGDAAIVVGTHAVFQEQVSFARLGLAVVDEQQRFGVLQRASLLAKGPQPHLLALTATPIPRSLALTLYGDLDLSLLDERPPRGEVATELRSQARRSEVYVELRAALEAGERGFVVCPRVEGPGSPRACVDTAEELAGGILEGLPIAVLHGRMDPAAKERAVARFRAGEVAALVSTSVVEVGVDVPEATWMVIEDAECFGLSSLHQLRGRVGRSVLGGRCVLISSLADSERLNILAGCNDGFEIARQDLRLRGPGDLVGERQAGSPAFRLSTSPGFAALLESARSAAQQVAARKDYEHAPELALLRAEVAARLPLAAAAEAG